LQLFGDIVHGASNDAQMTWLFERSYSPSVSGGM
jgi:hypothetical protein